MHLPYYNELWAIVLSPRLQERQLQLDPDHFGALLPLMWVAKPPMAIWKWTSACSGHQLGRLSVQIALAYLFHWFIWSPQISKNPTETLPWLFTKHKNSIQWAIPGSLLACTKGFLLERLHHLMRSNICTLTQFGVNIFHFSLIHYIFCIEVGGCFHACNYDFTKQQSWRTFWVWHTEGNITDPLFLLSTVTLTLHSFTCILNRPSILEPFIWDKDIPAGNSS